MALTNALLHELSTNTLEKNIELVRLTLRSCAYIPRKREIILLWLSKSIPQQTQARAEDVLTLWKLLHEVLQDVVPEQLAILMQKGFLEHVTQGIRMQLHPDTSQECYVLKVAIYLLEKTPSGILFLKQNDLESMLLTVLKCCCDTMSEGKNNVELISVLSLLLHSITSSLQKRPYSVQSTILHLKPLLGFMMMMLKLTENSSLPELVHIPGQIKKAISAALFNKNNLNDWIQCLKAILESEETVDGHTPAVSESAKKGSVVTSTEGTIPKQAAVTPQVPSNIVTPAPPCSTTTPLKKTTCQELPPKESLRQIQRLVDEAFESMASRGYSAADYIPLCLPVILEGFMSCNRSGNIHCNVALLAYLVTLLGIRSDVPFKKLEFQVLQLTEEQKLSCFNNLLEVYRISEEYHAIMVLPQKKKGSFRPKKWFREVGTCLEKTNYKTAAWFACVNTTMHISPNLVEGIMVKALQKCWVTNSLENSDIKNAQDMLLENIVLTFEKLFRIPKLLRNIFSSLSSLKGEDIGPVHVTSSFLKKFAKCCTGMSSGQLTECWSLFLNQLRYWIGISKANENNVTREITTTVEIFCTFLHHIQVAAPTMPTVDVTKISDLMGETPKLASQMLDCSTDGYLDKCAYCALQIFHAWGEVHIVLLSYRRSYSQANNKPSLEAPLEDIDLSYLQPVLTTERVSSLLAPLPTSKEVLYALLLLEIQKIRALLLCSEATGDAATESIAAAATFIFSHANMMAPCQVWDQRVCGITEEQFATAALQLLLTYSPIIASWLTAKNLVRLCEWLLHVLEDTMDVTLSEYNIIPKGIVMEYLNSSSFRESRPMQTAYVTALFHNLSERIRAKKRSHDMEGTTATYKSLFETLSFSPSTWKKYAESIPQMDNTSKKLVEPDDLNKMWNNIHNASQLTSSIMSSCESSECVTMESITFILQAMEYLPLEDLFPGNQTRCLLGLLGVLFLLRSDVKNKTCASEKTMLIKTTCNLLMTLLDGTRRPWLLDFLDGGFLFDKIVTLFSENFSQDLDDIALYRVYEELLNIIVRDAFRKRNTLRTFTPLVKQLKDLIPKTDIFKSAPFSAAAMVLFMQFVMEVSKKFLRKDTKRHIQKSASTLSKAFSLWLTHFLKDRTLHIEGRKQAFQISALQIKYAVAASRRHTEEECEEPCNEAVSAVLSMACTDIMESKDCSRMPEEALAFVSVAIKHRHSLPALPDLSVPEIWMSASFVFTMAARHSSECMPLTLENSLSEDQVMFLQGIFKCCTLKEVTDILGKLFTLMLNDEAHSSTVKVYLKTFQVLCSSLPDDVEDSSREIANLLQKFIEHFAATFTFLDMAKDTELVTGILQILETLLRLKKPSITHQSSSVILQVLCALDLGAAFNDMKLFCECYRIVCGMLSVFLQHRVYLISGCASIIHTCIAMLIRSLVRASGVEEVRRYPSVVVHGLLLCASSLESLSYSDEDLGEGQWHHVVLNFT
ncbi:uncharacterized protein LOC135385705 isoform X2 [Ornithodoros turicata]|uniref:uncharacterized protein LOC135385705 isoform X2 n=1 Tax=Ornithodoros turicata TaxID=34597 RepID=UPI003139C711